MENREYRQKVTTCYHCPDYVLLRGINIEIPFCRRLDSILKYDGLKLPIPSNCTLPVWKS